METRARDAQRWATFEARERFPGTFLIPLNFDPPAWEEAAHFTVTKAGRVYTVSWPRTGLVVRATKLGPAVRRDLLRHTPGLKFHEFSGYSLGDFHEFFIAGTEGRCEFVLADSRVSLGDTSPLAMLLFGGEYHRKAHGDEWEYYSTTLRIENVRAEEVESYLLKAIQVIDDSSSERVHLIPFGPVEYWEASELAPVPKRIRSIPLDLEPQRCFFRGIREHEDASACLQFYRVLEFFAFFEVQREVTVLRANHIADREFLLKVANIAFGNERGPIVRLVGRLATKSTLANAVRVGLISTPSTSVLGDDLYEFRNSFVHAKYDQRALIHSPSVIEEESKAREWRYVLERLARAAIAKLSTRRRAG